MAVAVVTDSTAYLPAELAGDITVVPLTVVIDGVAALEGVQVGPAEVAAALAEARVAVSTSRPAPARFAEVYRGLLDAGADAIVSVHLSARLSGTYDAAVLGAGEVTSERITVVDSGSTGMGLGFCALSAARAALSGAAAAEVATAARLAAASTETFFYVDTLEFLRRGGRISAASALVGTALSVKPILYVTGGAIAARDKVRTASRALERLVDLAVGAAGAGRVDIAVHHLSAAQRANQVGQALATRLGDRLRHYWTSEVGAVVAAHAGPGLVGVVVRRLG
jgi:DegV family protein with EDD domain